MCDTGAGRNTAGLMNPPALGSLGITSRPIAEAPDHGKDKEIGRLHGVTGAWRFLRAWPPMSLAFLRPGKVEIAG